MILLNFSHPLTEQQRAQVEAIAGEKIERLIEIPTQINPQQPLAGQVIALADQANLSPFEWQNAPLLVNPPALNYVAVLLTAELHGRCGYFPAMLRLRPVANSLPPQFEVAEIVNVQSVREEARRRRV
ncbi:MAG: CRISPR-associated protein Csx15 [Anaerolineales bacterium]|nr:CRISPR-associated protein Csx15 [Anaerolineales bacterium]MDW8447854.1 CRISPR-associated protein Csx15 [Anaerolineales bacterium]